MAKTNGILDVIYEDDDLIVLNKAAGDLSIQDRFQKTIPNLKEELRKIYGDIFVVHRLDKDTSGAIIFAKNAEAHRDLSMQFENREIKKIYHAIVQGIVSKAEMEIDIPISPNPVKKGLMIPTIRGKESLTIMRVLERFRAATLVECDMKTGRQHQIRVHCSTVGHPLLVDKDYGDRTEFFVSAIKKRFNLKKHTDEMPIIDRVPLHSYSMEFKHPKTGEMIQVTAPYPKDFTALLKILAKYSKLPDFLKNNTL